MSAVSTGAQAEAYATENKKQMCLLRLAATRTNRLQHRENGTA